MSKGQGTERQRANGHTANLGCRARALTGRKKTSSNCWTWVKKNEQKNGGRFFRSCFPVGPDRHLSPVLGEAPPRAPSVTLASVPYKCQFSPSALPQRLNLHPALVLLLLSGSTAASKFSPPHMPQIFTLLHPKPQPLTSGLDSLQSRPDELEHHSF